jgi:hypothetical protein
MLIFIIEKASQSSPAVPRPGRISVFMSRASHFTLVIISKQGIFFGKRINTGFWPKLTINETYLVDLLFGNKKTSGKYLFVEILV